jgi:uncharacterized phage infection (PIP) family protein YhgE
MMARVRRRKRDDDEWLSNLFNVMERGKPTGVRGGDTTMMPAGGQSMPQQGDKNSWLKTILSFAVPLFAGGAVSQMAKPPDAPHGGTLGQKPALASAMRAYATSIEQKQKADDILRQEQAAQQQQQFVNKLQQLKYGLDKWATEQEVQRRLKELGIEEKKTEAGIEKTTAETGRIAEETKMTEAEREYFAKHGYLPGRKSLVISTTPSGGGKPEPVESLDKKIYDLMSKVYPQSDNAQPFNALQGATSLPELDALYETYAGTVPASDLYGGNRSNFDTLYRYLKERFRKRGENVPQVEEQKPIVNENPLELDLW